jgi:elongin-C
VLLPLFRGRLALGRDRITSQPKAVVVRMSSSSQEAVSYVKLISAEGHEFFLDRQVAIEASKTIRLMLGGSFREAQDNVIRFPDIAGYVLERVVQYFHYKAQHSNSSNRLPTFNIEPEIALELLLAAKYLDC